MKNHNTTKRPTWGILSTASVAALSIGFTLALPPAAQAQTVITPPPVPANIQVDAPNHVFLLGRGVGTQNYVCAPSESIGQVAWILFTPQATLLSDQGNQLTTHFFSPNPVENIVRATWEDSLDTSTVWAKAVESSTDPNFVAPGAIAWLKLQVVGTAMGPTGGSTLTGTTFIQRLNTSGGAAPSTGCDLPTDIGKKAFVPYTADYFFYTK